MKSFDTWLRNLMHRLYTVQQLKAHWYFYFSISTCHRQDFKSVLYHLFGGDHSDCVWESHTALQQKSFRKLYDKQCSDWVVARTIIPAPVGTEKENKKDNLLKSKVLNGSFVHIQKQKVHYYQCICFLTLEKWTFSPTILLNTLPRKKNFLIWPGQIIL